LERKSAPVAIGRPITSHEPGYAELSRQWFDGFFHRESRDGTAEIILVHDIEKLLLPHAEPQRRPGNRWAVSGMASRLPARTEAVASGRRYAARMGALMLERQDIVMVKAAVS
jgi:hypothetical protein